MLLSLADCGSVATWICKPDEYGMGFRRRQPGLPLATAPTPQAALAPEPAPESPALAPATPWYLKEQPPAQAAPSMTVQAVAADVPAKTPTSIPLTRKVLSRWPTANAPASKTTAIEVKIPGNPSLADRAGAYQAACKRNPGKEASELPTWSMSQAAWIKAVLIET